MLNRSSRCRGAIKDTGAVSIDPPGIEEVSRLRLKTHTWQGIEEVSSKLLKLVFREVKNIDLNAIQHTTQPMIQSTQKSLKIVSQFKKK